MKGRIYSDQRCDLCQSKFKWDGLTGLYCPNHPEKQATDYFHVVFRPDIFKRFRNYPDAETFLLGIRHEHNEGKFDSRDYRKALEAT